ncbi:hypothetical protein [Aegicerativicinus sediminis]
MKTTQQLLTEISTLLRQIEEEHPELYKYLDETPMTIPDMENPDIDQNTLNEYLESLKSMVDNYEKEH